MSTVCMDSDSHLHRPTTSVSLSQLRIYLVKESRTLDYKDGSAYVNIIFSDNDLPRSTQAVSLHRLYVFGESLTVIYSRRNRSVQCPLTIRIQRMTNR